MKELIAKLRSMLNGQIGSAQRKDLEYRLQRVVAKQKVLAKQKRHRRHIVQASRRANR